MQVSHSLQLDTLVYTNVPLGIFLHVVGLHGCLPSVHDINDIFMILSLKIRQFPNHLLLTMMKAAMRQFNKQGFMFVSQAE